MKTHRSISRLAIAASLWAATLSPQLAFADPLIDSGKLLATAGVSNVEGAGGGGIATWALITGYGTRDAIGANAHYTYVPLPDFTVHTAGAAIGLYDRVEVSYAHLWFETGATGAKLGLGRNFQFQQDVIGAKVKMAGDAIYAQDSWLPQIAIGAAYKRTNHGDVLRAIGAREDSDVDCYVTASKLFLGQNLLVNGAIRLTRANQLGILGFGGDRANAWRPQVEGSLVYLFSRDLAAGVEYRTKPDNLRLSHESAWKDVFLAYFLNKNASITAAYVDLGTIATLKNQRGAYLSLQVGF